VAPARAGGAERDVSTAPLARRLADDVVALRSAPLSDAVATRATDLLLDFLGVALGGVPEPSSVAVRRGLALLELRGDAAVLGTGERLPAPQAALANGAAAHALEMDDTHLGGSIHLGASVFAAALATAQLTSASGEALVRATIAGYEVAARLAMALHPAAHYARGFHPTGTCGAFGAAAAAGLLFGLDAETMTSAFGVAGSQAAGSMEFLADGTWTKRLHPGWAACAGVHAAALARAGFRAPASIFEGRFGVLHALSDGASPAPLSGGGELEIMRTGVKPHACCRYAQGPIDAVLALRARHGLDPDAVTRVEVGLVAAAFPIICEPAAHKRRPTSVVDMQFSLPFSVAVALARGSASPAEFALETLDDARVMRLLEVVEPVRDAELDAQFPRVWPAWVRVHRRDGSWVEERVSHPSGDPEHFLSRAELAAKFRRLASRSLDDQTIGRVEALATGVMSLAKAVDIADAATPAVTPLTRAR